MLIDVPVSRSRILVVGGGAVAERKVRKLVRECPNILVASKRFTRGLSALRAEGKIRLMKAEAGAKIGILDRAIASSDILIVATSDPEINGKIAERAREHRVLVNAADNPGASDFWFPAVAVAGDVRIAVSTGGSSPAMARLLCRRLGRKVSKADQRQVRLQGKVREFAARTLPDAASRKRALYAVLRDGRVQGLLSRRDLRGAEGVAKQIIVKESGGNAER